MSDLRQYLEENKQAAWDLAAMVKVNQVNKATLTLFKAGTEEEFIRSIDQVFGPDAIDVFIGELCAFWEKKEVFRSETLHKTLDGEELTVIISMPIPKTEEGLKSVPVSLLDITDLKQSETTLADSVLRCQEISLSPDFHRKNTSPQVLAQSNINICCWDTSIRPGRHVWTKASPDSAQI